MIRVLGESLSVPLTAGRVAGDRPPIRLLPASPPMRHCDELPWGAELLGYRIDLVAHRPAGLETSGQASGDRRHG
jgi:hypothetical protein